MNYGLVKIAKENRQAITLQNFDRICAYLETLEPIFVGTVAEIDYYMKANITGARNGGGMEVIDDAGNGYRRIAIKSETVLTKLRKERSATETLARMLRPN